MPPASPSPLLRLFGADPPGPGGSLQHIRDKIYSHVWSRVRRDDSKLDFVVSEHGINRNVPERLFSSEDPGKCNQAPRMPPPACNLHLVNKPISKDFTRYVYSMNGVQIDVDLKALSTVPDQAALGKIAVLLDNPNFQKHTRRARLRIHFPSEYPVAKLPKFNQTALGDIASAIDKFQNINYLGIRVVCVQGVPHEYELRLSLFPFYPLHLTTWSARVLSSIRPYQWELLNAQSTALLNQAYQEYVETGNLTATVPLPVDKKPLGISNTTANKKSPQNSYANKKTIQISNIPPNTMPNKESNGGTKSSASVALQSSRAPANGSQKKRLRKKIQVAPEVVKAEGLPNPKAYKQTVRMSSRVPPSPPLSPWQEKEILAPVSSSDPNFGQVATSPATSLGCKLAVEDAITAHSETNIEEVPAPSSPAASSVTLGPASEGVATGDADSLASFTQEGIDKSAGVDGHNAQESETTKKLRNKKSKRTKRKTKTANSDKTHRNASPADDVDAEFEVDEMKLIDRETSESLTVIDSRGETAIDSMERSFSSYSAAELSRGTWMVISDGHALFTHPDSSIGRIVSRDAKVNRHLNHYERRLAAQQTATIKETKPTKTTSVKKTRQSSMRRGHVAADSPLSRVMGPVRPRDTVPKQIDSASQAPSADLAISVDLLCRLIAEELQTQGSQIIQQRRETTGNHLQQLQLDRIIEEQDDSEVDGSDDEFDDECGIQADRLGFVESDGDSTASNSGSKDMHHSSTFISQPAEADEDQHSASEDGSAMKQDEALAWQLQQGAALDANDPVSEVDATRPTQLNGASKVFVPSHALNHLQSSTNDDFAQCIESQGQVGQHSPYTRTPENGDLLNGHVSYHLAQLPTYGSELLIDNNHSDRVQWSSGRGRGRGRGQQHSRVNYTSGREDYDPAQGNHRGSYNHRGDCNSRQGSHRGNYSSAPDSQPRKYMSGQGKHDVGRTPVSKALNSASERRNAWVIAAQNSDRAFGAINVERRRALEQDMEAKGKTIRGL